MILYQCNRCGKFLQVGTKCGCRPDLDYRNEHKRKGRDRKIESFRASRAWRDMRESILIRDGNMDRLIYARTGEIVPATSVHHIYPLHTPEGWARRLDPRNLISLSVDNHGRVEALYGTAKEKAIIEELERIVCGDDYYEELLGL